MLAKVPRKLKREVLKRRLHLLNKKTIRLFHYAHNITEIKRRKRFFLYTHANIKIQKKKYRFVRSYTPFTIIKTFHVSDYDTFKIIYRSTVALAILAVPC